MSIDNRLENFDKLIKLLADIPEYAPNEKELTQVAFSLFQYFDFTYL